MTEQNYDVLILGGGMVGAAIATALGSQGINVAVFDRTSPEPLPPEAPPLLRVSALSQASEHILRQLGAWPFIAHRRITPYRQMKVWEKLHHPWGREITSRPNQVVFDAAGIDQEQLGFIVENRVTQLGLMQAMSQHDSVEFICPAQVSRIDLSTSQPRIELADGRRFIGDLLVGADGAHSRVREAACLGLVQSDYEQQCLVATVEIAGGCQDTTWQAFTPTGPEAFLPLPEIAHRSYGSVVWYHQPEEVQRLMGLTAERFIDELQNTFPVELPTILALHERGAFPLAQRHAIRYCRTGVVLAGDAAHTINPLAGQGVNLGFQDAAWLAEILVAAYRKGQNLGASEVLQQYEQARRTDNALMMRVMDGFYHGFSNHNRPLQLLRNIGLGVAGHCTPAIHQVMKYAMGVSGRQPKLARGEPL